MMFFPLIGSAIGGLGLFVLGMWLMSQGLKTTAGDSLNHFLRHWTKTRLRGLSLGFLLTTLIQSSSAITVTVIGFSNAGLLSLKRAIWIVFGSNIGTTTTGWIVTLIGFNVQVSSLALPLVGIGMFLKLTQANNKLSGLGQALVGFGILFLGISVLKETFSDLGQHISLSGATDDTTLFELLFFLGIGFFITLLMQSSSATLALTLTALSGGLITLLPAAAIVIGGNLGTTSTALLASMGTGPVAKRVVASHIIFNLLSGIVTFVFLAPFVSLILYGQQLFDLNDSPTVTLALFHTFFNILGVLLIWPLANNLIQWLSNRFKNKDTDETQPIYLNKQSLTLPSLALHALNKELERVGNYALTMAKDSINFEAPSPAIIYKDNLIKGLINSIGDYTAKLYKQNLTDEISAKLPAFLRISQYYSAISDLSLMINTDKLSFESPIDPSIQQQINQYLKHSIYLLDTTHLEQKTVSKPMIEKQLEVLEAEYQALKSLLLRRGAEGMLSIAKMDKKMTQISHIRRINQQAVKAYIYFLSLEISDDKNTENDMITTSV